MNAPLTKYIFRFFRNLNDQKEFNEGLLKEDSFRRICRDEIINSKNVPVRCHFLHHFDPYLKLGPFKLEELWIRPYRSKIHEFLTDEEIDYLITASKPHLSEARKKEKLSDTKSTDQPNVGTVHKTVQYWLEDVIYKENATFQYIEGEEGFKMYQLMPMKDLNSYVVKDMILLKLSKKIELATQTNILTRFGSTDYQVWI